MTVGAQHRCLRCSGAMEDDPFSCSPDVGSWYDPAEFDRQWERAMSTDLRRCEYGGCERYAWWNVTDLGFVRWFCRMHYVEKTGEEACDA